ncbi:MAG: ChaN family lipoprotein [Candidatus Korobacteraceae bacterium]|jgi:hypothetical protein
MGTYSHLHQRRNAAQHCAVSQVEREVKAADPYSGDEYIRVFAEAFQSYRSRLSRSGLLDELLQADVLLVADYHALPASQLYAASLVEQLSAVRQRPLVLALEAIYARDQRVLDAWRGGLLDERELRSRIRFDLDWGFGWNPFFRLLAAARQHGVRVCGLDSAPRGDLRRIALRDVRAAERIATLARKLPDSRLVVLFGESHMAPQHLPALVKRQLPESRVLTLLQNVDSLYWQAAEEPGARVKAVQVSDDVFCVFNATPLEKYESYRQCLERWR